MTMANEPAERPVVAVLRRPPIRQSTLVRASAQHTFTTFVTTIGAWWPVQPFSAGQDRVRDITVEQRQGGRVYETWDDGTEADWGTLLTWQPPERFAMTWTGTPAPTEVEFTFTALGPALTRVTVEHRGWETLTDEQLAEDCALPGGYNSGAYSQGWATILARLASAVASGASPVTYAGDAALPAVTDEMLRDALQRTRPYTVCILKATSAYQSPGPARDGWVANLIWEHGKRNYALHLAGLMRVVCPIGDGSGTTGVSIFDADPDEVDQLMRQDPGVKAGLFSYEIHATQTFPESTLTSASRPRDVKAAKHIERLPERTGHAR